MKTDPSNKSHSLSGTLPKKIPVNVGPVQETMFIPLWARAAESSRRRPMLRDPKSVDIVQRLAYDFGKFRRAHGSRIGCCIRSLEFDRYVRAFLRWAPNGTVVEMGAGLNTRFERVDNGSVSWVDVDLPDVVALRQQFFRETDRRKSVAASVTQAGWLEQVKRAGRGPWMFCIEGVLMYLSAGEVKRLFGRIGRHFPGALVVFDVLGRHAVRNQHRHDTLRRMQAPFQWAIDRVSELDSLDTPMEILHRQSLASIIQEHHRSIPLFWRWAAPALLSLIPGSRTSYRYLLVRLS